MWIPDQQSDVPNRRRALAQFEIELHDWRPMQFAPIDATWVDLELSDHTIVRAHFAQDLSGEEQPPFRGWYCDAGLMFHEVWPKPNRWRPE